MTRLLATLLSFSLLFSSTLALASDEAVDLDIAASLCDQGSESVDFGMISSNDGWVSVGLVVLGVAGAFLISAHFAHAGRMTLTMDKGAFDQMRKELASNDSKHQWKNMITDLRTSRRSPQELAKDYGADASRPTTRKFLKIYNAALDGKATAG